MTQPLHIEQRYITRYFYQLHVQQNIYTSDQPLRIFHIARSLISSSTGTERNRVRYFRGRVSNFNQSEARKQCFLASDWFKFVTLLQKYRTLYQYIVKYLAGEHGIAVR